MTDMTHRQYLFILPLPITPPNSKNPRLGGLIFVRTDASFNMIGQKEYLACKLPLHELAHPAYLLSQGIIPNSNLRALSTYKFMSKVKELFSYSNLYIITYGANYLDYLNEMALSVFYKEDIFFNVKGILDLKTAFITDAFFSDLKALKIKDDIISKAKFLGFNDDISRYDINKKLDLVLYIFKYMQNKNQRLILYLLQDKVNYHAFIAKAINLQSNIVYIENSSKKLLIIKPLSIDDTVLKALCFKDNEPCLIAINLNQFELLAPLSILTANRLSSLNIDIEFETNRLDSEALKNALNKYSLPKYILQKQGQNSIDKSFIDNIKNVAPQSLSVVPASISKDLKEKIFLYRADNFLGSLMDQELSSYYRFAKNQIEKNLSRYYKECDLVASNLDENDEKGKELIAKIINYPSTL